MIELKLIHPLSMLEHAEDIRPYIESGLAQTYGESTADDILDRCFQGLMYPVVIKDGEDWLAVIVLEVAHYPQLKRLRIVTLSGKDARRWGPTLVQGLVTWCENAGFAGIEGTSRPDSWYQKLLHEVGAKDAYIFSIYEVDHGKSAA